MDLKLITSKRTANFTSTETELLVSLVMKYKNIVECLKTDTINSKMKKDAWHQIQIEFNSQSVDNPRTAIVLKNKYDNIKRNVKKQYAEEKTFSRGTGGGPTKLFPGTSISSTVGEMLQNRMTGETSIYDSDNIECETVLVESDNINCIIDNDDEEIITVSNFTDTNESDFHKIPSSSTTKRDWTNYTPGDLKSTSNLTANSNTISGSHITKKHKAYQDKITSWASNRASLSEKQQIAFIEQHKLKMQLMQQKHDVSLKMMAEEHDIKIKNLQLQNEILQIQKEKEKKLM